VSHNTVGPYLLHVAYSVHQLYIPACILNFHHTFPSCTKVLVDLGVSDVTGNVKQAQVSTFLSCHYTSSQISSDTWSASSPFSTFKVWGGWSPLCPHNSPLL